MRSWTTRRTQQDEALEGPGRPSIVTEQSCPLANGCSVRGPGQREVRMPATALDVDACLPRGPAGSTHELAENLHVGGLESAPQDGVVEGAGTRESQVRHHRSSCEFVCKGTRPAVGLVDRRLACEDHGDVPVRWSGPSRGIQSLARSDRLRLGQVVLQVLERLSRRDDGEKDAHGINCWQRPAVPADPP